MTEIDGDYYYPGYGYPYDDGQAERTNCLVDGAVPEFLTTKANDSDIIPSGTLPDSPHLMDGILKQTTVQLLHAQCVYQIIACIHCTINKSVKEIRKLG